MSESRPRPERIDLAQADDLRDVVHRAVACIVGGGLLGHPTDAGYAVTAAITNSEVGSRLLAKTARSQIDRPTLLLRNATEALDWVPRLSEIGSRLARRTWPGSVTLVVPGPKDYGLAGCLPATIRDSLFHDDRVALRVPPDGLLRDVLRLTPGPVASIEFATRDQSDSELADLDMVILDRRASNETGPTVVAIDAHGWKVERPGVVANREIAAMAGTIWVFVCTGNTCRSPMAEAICKVLLAKRLGCSVPSLIDRGFVVVSAGVSASEGSPAAPHAVEVVATRGGSLKSHASRTVTDSLIRNADLILALAGEHLSALLDYVPDAADKIRMLHWNGDDVADPIGSDRATYQDTAIQIESAIAHLLDELGI